MKKNMKTIYGVVSRNGKERWTPIGVGFENSDRSFNLLFDFVPTSAETTIQLREPKRALEKAPPAEIQESASA